MKNPSPSRSTPARQSIRIGFTILLTTLLPARLAAGPANIAKFQFERDAETAAVRSWRRLIENNPDYAIRLLDGFNQEQIWRINRLNGTPSDIRRLPSSNTDEAFKMERQLLLAAHPTENDYPDQRLTLHAMLQDNGAEDFLLEPQRELFADGECLRFSVWVKSAGYRHRLYALMRDPFGKKHRLALGSLEFEGWRRLEIGLPAAFQRRNKLAGEPYRTGFLGFVLRSSPREVRGQLYLELDNPLLLVNRAVLRYPGSDIPDDWGNFRGKKRAR